MIASMLFGAALAPFRGGACRCGACRHGRERRARGASPAIAAVTATPSQGAASCLPLTARNADGNYIVSGVRGAIVYRRIGSGSGATELSLDAYVQPGGGGPRPGVIVLHGGGWERGSRAAFTGQFLELLTRAGYNWVAVDYRLGTLADHDRAVDDVQAAIAFVRCHARELEIDPARLVLWGEDTGAQLAALLASRASSGVRAMVLVGGFYDLHAAGSISDGQCASPREFQPNCCCARPLCTACAAGCPRR